MPVVIPASRRTVVVGAVVALGTLLATTGPLYRVRTWWRFDDPLAADPVVVAVQVALGLAGAIALIRFGRWRRMDRRMAVVGLALVAWLALGSLWSANPSTTLRESLLIGVGLVAGAGAAAAAGDRLLVVAAWIGVHLGLGWSAIMIALVRPGTQFHGQWTGVYFNPNSLALVAAFGILLSVVLLVMVATRRIALPGRWRIVALGVIAASIVADLRLSGGTGALTPLFGLGVALAVGAAAIAARRIVAPADARRTAAVAGVGLVGVGAVAWFTRGSWLSVFDRTSELTGRTAMWDVALDWFADRPIVGHGYLGAWYDPEFTAEMLEARGEVLGSTHNSFVELLLGAGLVGFVLAVALYALLWLAAGTRALGGRWTASVWPLAVLVYVVVEQLGETLFVGGHLMVVATGALVVASTSEQASPPPEPSADPVVGSAGEAEIVDLERRS
ncbi:MAG TPA: O-antigen ligase family protein [Ilumatobacteraceae bacterium]|nr:O-antigen ligase family protein [Ilumatobacteraceae bacterium]